MVREEGAGVGWGWGAEERGEKGRDREMEGKRNDWRIGQRRRPRPRPRVDAQRLCSWFRAQPPHAQAQPTEGRESHGGNSPGASDKPCLNLGCELNCPLLVSRKPRRLTSASRRLALKVAIRKPEEIPGAPPQNRNPAHCSFIHAEVTEL